MAWKYYDYVCQDCGHAFEAMVKDMDEWVDCTECEKGPCERQITANLGWSNNQETRVDMLKKRSTEHTASEQRKGNLLSPKDLIGK